MGLYYNYGVVVYMLLFTAALIVHLYINHSRDTKRFRIIRWGLFLLLLNQLTDILRAGITYEGVTCKASAVYLIYGVYYVTEATIMLLIVMYMLTLFPALAGRRRMLQTIFFVGEAVAIVAILSTPFTGLTYRMDSSVLVVGSGSALFFIGRLVVLILFLLAVIGCRRMLPSRLFENWIAVLVLSICIHAVPLFFQNLNGFGMFANTFFCLVYGLFHSSSFEEGTARMGADGYYREIDYCLAKKRNFYVFEIQIQNYESLIGRGCCSEEELSRIYDMLLSKLPEKNRHVVLFQKRSECLGAVAAGMTPDEAEMLAGQMCQWMSSFLDGKLVFGIVAVECPEYASDVRETERLLQFLQQKCPQNGSYFCSRSDCDKLRARKEVLLLLHNLRMEKQDVVLFGRPVIDGKSSHIERFEILCRAQMAGSGIIHGDQIVSIAEQYGYIHDVNMAVLKNVCDYLTTGAAGREDLRVSLHISSSELENPDFADDVLAIIKNYSIAPETLGFEVTITPGACDIHKMYDVMNILREHQIIFILTDFHPESINFESVVGLPFRTVKFDQRCVKKASESPISFDAIGLLVDLLKERGYDVVFKGIEDEKLEEIVLSLGADYLQGSKYAKPLPIEGIVEQLDLSAMF